MRAGRASVKAQLATHLEAARAAEAVGDSAAAVSSYQAAVVCDAACASARLGLACALRGDAADACALDGVETQLRAACECALAATRADERDVLPVARSHLALLLAQAGERDKAAHSMMRLLGCCYRLSREVLCYELPPPLVATAPVDVAAGLDAPLPDGMVEHLGACFAADGAFWKEHRYWAPSTGYFSYAHPLEASAGSAFDQVLSAIRSAAVSLRPEVGRATHCEWWAHCRPHSCGHQLHFDSDAEGAPDASGAPRHPIASCVLYLDATVGGPTLVTSQRRCDAALAERAYLAFPQRARLLVFHGGVLHGVIPGRGPSPAPGARRTTLMVAFWEGLEAVAGAQPGASRPFPAEVAEGGATWAHQLAGGPPRPDWGTHAAAEALRRAPPAPLRSLQRCWEDADSGSCEREQEGVALAQLKGLPHYSSCYQGF